VISTKGIVRHTDGTTPVEAGDAFIFGPDQPHQLTNDGSQDIILYMVADNPTGESCYYPDSKNGWCACPSAEFSAPSRWTATMVKNEACLNKIAERNASGRSDNGRVETD
jgi:uncharacterized cupin superfamily protein